MELCGDNGPSLVNPNEGVCSISGGTCVGTTDGTIGIIGLFCSLLGGCGIRLLGGIVQSTNPPDGEY